MSHQEREKIKLMQRLKKLRGQLEAVERSLMADEDCGGQLMLLAAVRGGVNGLMGEVLETHIRFHLVEPRSKLPRNWPKILSIWYAPI